MFLPVLDIIWAMALSKLPETLINTLEFLLDKKELHSWSSYEENGQVKLTVKFKDNSSDVGHSTPSYSSFKDCRPQYFPQPEFNINVHVGYT